MRAYVCNQCQLQMPADQWEALPPVGWFSVRARLAEHKHAQADLCSTDCVARWFERQAALAVQEAAEVYADGALRS